MAKLQKLKSFSHDRQVLCEYRGSKIVCDTMNPKEKYLELIQMILEHSKKKKNWI
jgi:hypothetical protein